MISYLCLIKIKLTNKSNIIPAANVSVKRNAVDHQCLFAVTGSISSSYCLAVLARCCLFFNPGICREHISVINLCLQQKARKTEKSLGGG